MKVLFLKVACALLLVTRQGDGLVSEAAKVAARFIGGAAEDLSLAPKLICQPAEQLLMGALVRACEPIKHLFGIRYTDMKTMGSEPNLESLKITVVSPNGLKWYSITEASRFNSSFKKTLDCNKKLVVFVHGFIEDPNALSFSAVSRAFLSRGDCNVAALDCSSLIRWLYVRCTEYVRFIGERLAAVLAELDKGCIPRENIILVGHSLGSHIAGWCGKTFEKMTRSKLPCIVCLDPAGPCFAYLTREMRLSKNDAEYMQVIHTNGGIFGLKEPVGHADFYPNGGESQPGCLEPVSDHSRSWEYFAESARNDTAFMARKCDDWTTFLKGDCGNRDIGIMGLRSNHSLRGIFYLRTAATSPYGMGRNGLVCSNATISVCEGLLLEKCTKLVDSINKA